MPLLAAVTVPKLVGSEGCDGAGVTVKEVQSDRVSVNVSPKMDSPGSFPGQNEAAVWNKMVNGELCKHANQVSSPHVEEASNDLNIGSTSNPIQLLPELDAKHQKQNFGRVEKSNNGCSKRSQVTHLEVSINETETSDKKGKAEVGLSPAKCIVTEKTQTPKQKNLNGKGGDKRNGRAPKGKCDSFSVKSGLASFSSAAGGNNILGVYGSRPDTEDVTKHVDEFSLTELLDGSYECPSFAKDKGKKSANPNANILQSLREAWSILRMQKIKPQTMEIDGSYQEVPPPSILTSDSFVASKRAAGDKGDTNMTDLSSGHKVDDSGSKLNTSANIVDFPLYQPKDILECLTLPPPKDLEVLIQDAAKPAAASRNNSDLRVGRPVSHRGCLPPFSWSNASSGHCKSNSDAVKLSTSRTTCQGRWVKIENPITSLETTSCFLSELKSLTYDHNLVPSEFQNLVPPRDEKDSPKSVSITEQGLLSCPVDPQASPAGHSPRVLAASQILCDMASHSSKQNAYGVIKWVKKPSQKSMRACNLKPNEKSDNISATPTTKVGSDSMVNTPEEMMPSKKLRLSVNGKSADRVHNNTIAKGPLYWSMPRSSRSSPRKSIRDSAVETKQNSVNIVKKSYMPPPPVRKLDSPCSSQPKPRKLMRIGWNREGGKLE